MSMNVRNAPKVAVSEKETETRELVREPVVPSPVL